MSPGAVMDWAPTASLEALRLRAAMLEEIRAYFRERNVLEVETPALGMTAVTDLHLASLEVRPPGHSTAPPRYLHTSPEYAMKRLLAAGSGDIWQAARVFRAEELSRRHNVEFTLIEWYRTGFALEDLIADIDALLRRCLAGARVRQGRPLAAAPGTLPGTAPGTVPGPLRVTTHREAFLAHAGVDSLGAPLEELRAAAHRHLGSVPAGLDDRDDLLDLLLGTVVAPQLGRGEVTYLVDWPASQAALARLRLSPDGVPVAARVEAYVEGLELCNGFEELTDPVEQRERFARDTARRAAAGLPQPAMDERFLAALAHGLPPCSGVALGFDRLAMLAAGATHLGEVMAFPHDRA